MKTVIIKSDDESCEMDIVIAIEIISTFIPLKPDFRLDEAWRFLKKYVMDKKCSCGKLYCENCGGKLVATCVNKKCDWSPLV